MALTDVDRVHGFVFLNERIETVLMFVSEVDFFMEVIPGLNLVTSYSTH